MKRRDLLIVQAVLICIGWYCIWKIHFEEKPAAEAPSPAPKPALVQRVRLYSHTGVMIGEYRSEGPVFGGAQYGHYFTDAATGRRVEFTLPYVSETVER